jgi:hypothetical protein
MLLFPKPQFWLSHAKGLVARPELYSPQKHELFLATAAKFNATMCRHNICGAAKA